MHLKRGLAAWTLSILFAACAPEIETRNELAYRFRTLEVEGEPRLQVALDFRPDSDGQTRLLFPDRAWGQEGLHATLASVRLTAANHKETRGIGRATALPDSGWIVLDHPKQLDHLRVVYELRQDFEGPVSTRNVYRPIITEDYFHVFGHNLLAYPERVDSAVVRFDWSGIRTGARVHNSFGTGRRLQRLAKTSPDRFTTAIFTGGDFRVRVDSIAGNHLSLATRGDWVALDEDSVFDVLRSTVAYQRDFWKDHGQAYFTVTLHPFPQVGGSSFQGTGLTNSFATSVSNNDEIELDQLIYLFNHELMHNWIGTAIPNAEEERQYWFSEGFTDYYAFKNIAAGGIGGLGVKGFIEDLNGLMRNWHTSPVRNVANDSIDYDRFWTDRDYGKLPYYRGALFAFFLDLKLQDATGGARSLDDVMRRLLVASRDSGAVLDREHFIRTFNAVAPFDVSAFQQMHIEEGHDFALAEVLRAYGFEFRPRSEVYDLGFTLDSTGTRVESVRQGSAAYGAGLRAGDGLYSRSIWPGNIDFPVTLGVSRDGRKRQLSFRAVREEDVPSLLDTASNRELLRVLLR